MMPPRNTTAAVLAAVALIAVPSPGASAAPRDNGSSLSELQAKRNEVRSQKANQAGQVDALEATDAQVSSALEALNAQVKAQQDKVEEIEVSGRNLAEGVPRNFTINSNEVLEALHEPLAGITSAMRAALEQTPPELCADVAERGIVLTGGGALLRDLDRLISEETGLHVHVADDPLTCVARGGGRALELIDMHGNDFFAPE